MHVLQKDVTDIVMLKREVANMKQEIVEVESKFRTFVPTSRKSPIAVAAPPIAKKTRVRKVDDNDIEVIKSRVKKIDTTCISTC